MDRVGIDLTSSYSDGDKKSKLDESKQVQCCHSNSSGCNALIHHWLYISTCVLAAVAMVLLGLIEHPGIYWTENDYYFISTGLPIIVILQLMLITFLGLDVGIRIIWLKHKTQFAYLRAIGRIAILTIMLIDAIVTAITLQPHPMLLWGFQYLLVVDTVLMNDAQRFLYQTMDCIKSISDILLMFLFITAFFIFFEFIEFWYKGEATQQART